MHGGTGSATLGARLANLTWLLPQMPSMLASS